jgi:hypothetical protein
MNSEKNYPVSKRKSNKQERLYKWGGRFRVGRGNFFSSPKVKK